jgi:hypothetical protein
MADGAKKYRVACGEVVLWARPSEIGVTKNKATTINTLNAREV